MDFIALENRVSAPNYAPLPVVLTRGEGSYLWDVDGRRYVDMMSAYSAVSLGHAHPRILAALTAQAQRLAVPCAPITATASGRFSRSLPRQWDAHCR
jgi:ornithine--oxo-acid transaminase